VRKEITLKSVNFLIKTCLLLAGVVFLVAGVYVGRILFTFFDQTSYRFVMLFLLIILLSNILAKLAIAYLKND